MSKILCAISGGVDSAVAAFLLRKKGYKIHGIFMKNWDLNEEIGQCEVNDDREYAIKVCQSLDISFCEVDLVKEYWNYVFEPLLRGYELGKTPNPDVLCNKHIKFDALLKKSRQLFNSDVILTTGHYARTTLGDKVLSKNTLHAEQHLIKAVDPHKDQTFFLHKLDSTTLKSIYFPLGGLHKSDVKQIAKNSAISFTLDRKESMGICFIGSRNFEQFLENYINPKPGRFICLESDKVVGFHNSYFSKTVGQRSKIPGMVNSYAVLHRDIETGDVIVAPGTDHPSFFSKSLISSKVCWVSKMPIELENHKILKCQFRIFHREPLIDCTVRLLDNGNLLIILKHPIRAITVGQDAVLYSNDKCLGGSNIIDVGPSIYECRNGEFEFNYFRKNAQIWTDLLQRFGRDLAAFPDNVSDIEVKNYISEARKINVL